MRKQPAACHTRKCSTDSFENGELESCSEARQVIDLEFQTSSLDLMPLALSLA